MENQWACNNACPGNHNNEDEQDDEDDCGINRITTAKLGRHNDNNKPIAKMRSDRWPCTSAGHGVENQWALNNACPGNHNNEDEQDDEDDCGITRINGHNNDGDEADEYEDDDCGINSINGRRRVRRFCINGWRTDYRIVQSIKTKNEFND